MIFMTRFYHSSRYFSFFKSIGNSLIFIIRAFFFFIAVALAGSCEEGPTTIGSELLPSNDFVSIISTDTLSVWSYTMYNASVPTSNPSVGLIGNIYDQYYGTTTAEFVSQLRLGSGWIYGQVTIDSVKLFLKFLTVTGGSTDHGAMLRISEIADQLYSDSTYYSDNQTDTTNYGVSVQLPVLRADTINEVNVSLPVQFGQYLLRDTSMLFYSNTKPDWRSFFKGIYFRLTPEADPLLLSFSLVTQVTSGGEYNNFFVVYMHDTAYVKSRYYFILDPVHPNAAYNRVIRDFSTADPSKKIPHINDMNYRDTLTYMQYLNGVYTKFVFPGLDSLKKTLSKGKFSINKARITLPVYYDGDQYTVLTIPSSLRLRYTDPAGLKYDVPDYNIGTTTAFFDGKLHKLDSTYYFNIPTFIQNYLEDTKNEYKPELDVYQGAAGLKSVILKANESKTPVKFEMTYTKF
jgi:hypothetical protein